MNGALVYIKVWNWTVQKSQTESVKVDRSKIFRIAPELHPYPSFTYPLFNPNPNFTRPLFDHDPNWILNLIAPLPELYANPNFTSIVIALWPLFPIYGH